MSDLKKLFIEDVPLIDVRAPVEFHSGAFPAAINLPILNDQERETVGTCYKEEGHEAAEALGYKLVCGELKTERIEAWKNILAKHPDAQLYCFRGGKRSEIATTWLKDAGYSVPRIEGGYKKMRSYLLNSLETLPEIIVIGGQTGVGKTELLEHFDNKLDLEALARHRGSAFGGTIDQQPSQIDFENQVAIACLKLKTQSDARMFVEDEGRLIGRMHVPLPLQNKMKVSPLIVLTDTVENRANRIYEEYIVTQWQDYQLAYGAHAEERFADYLLNAVDAIRKRLGGALHQQIRMVIERALHQDNQQQLHLQWIRELLENYYDPMYNYQLAKKTERIRISGTADELLNWAREYQSKRV